MAGKAQSQSLQGDEGPIQSACNLVSSAVSLQMCQGLAATIASPAAVAPVSLASAGTTMAMTAVPKLLERFL